MDDKPVDSTEEVDEQQALYAEVESPEQQAEREVARKLDAFGNSLAKSRSKNIGYRQQSGIEEIWREDQDFFEGVDDLNRGDERLLHNSKPPASGGSARGKKQGRGQSRVFPNITAPFCEAAAAHMSDILLPTEDRPWSLEPTPIPELWEKAKEYSQTNPKEAEADSQRGFLSRVQDRLFNPGRNESEERDANLQDQRPDMTPEEAFKQVELAKAVGEATETRVWDWHVDCQFNAQNRKVIESGSKIGTGILKGPIPREEMNIGWIPEESMEDDELGNKQSTPGGIKLSTEVKPYSKEIDPWNFYPASGCGDNIQNGDNTWERDHLTIRQLRQLAKDSTYLPDQIALCLKDGPKRAIAEVPETNSLSVNMTMEDKYEVWYGYCMATRDDLEAAGCDCEGLDDPYLDCLVVMVNERVIKATLPTTDHGGFPYDVFCWRKRKNFWAGIGVSRQVRTAQKMVVGATRSMMNNAGLAGGPMIVFKQGVVRPADGVAGLGPRKIFYISKDDQSIADATKAIGQIKIDIMVNEMMAIINYGLQQAENNSGFPMLMQGQMGGAPDRVGVVNVLDKNTNAIKRRLARNYSDDVMSPHLKRYYIYHLMYGPDNEKGDLQANVKGYASLVERDIQNQELGQMYSIVTDPRFGLDPKKWALEYLKSRHLPAGDLVVDDEEWGKKLEQWDQMMQQSQNGDPRIQVEQIRQEGATAREQIKGEFGGAIQLNKAQAHAVDKEMDRRLEMILSAANQEIATANNASTDANVVKKSKTDLAKKVMEIQSVWKLADMEAGSDLMPKPPFEPPGRAEPGHSYQQ
jgi:hypothetical protein